MRLCQLLALSLLLPFGSCASSGKSAGDGDLRWSPSWAPYEAGSVQGDHAVNELFISETTDGETQEVTKGIVRRLEVALHPKLEELVPARYKSLLALSDEEAVVRYISGGVDRLKILDLASGDERAIVAPDGFRSVEQNWLSYSSLGWRWSEDGHDYHHNRLWIELTSNEAGARDIMVLEADGSSHAVAQGLKPLAERGGAYEILEDFVGLYDTDEAGAERCWTYTKDGNLLSGPLPGLEEFALADTKGHPGFDVETWDMEVVVRIGEMDNRPDPNGDYNGRGMRTASVDGRRGERIAFLDPSIYAPLDKSGALAPLPAGVVGLMRLVSHVPDRRDGRWTHYRSDVTKRDEYHSGWAVLFGTSTGQRQFGFALGHLADVLAAAPGLKRYDAWEQANSFQFDFDGSWQPARIFAKRASDGVWETIDIESMSPYGLESYGDNLAWSSPLESEYLSSLKMLAFDVYDQTGAIRATERRNRDIDAEEAEREAEATRLALTNKERLGAVHGYIASGQAHAARQLLVEWDLGAGERGAWASYYRRFGCRDAYELQHARDMGVDEETLAVLEDVYLTIAAENAASAAAAADAEAQQAAWDEALRFKPTVERVEIDYLPNGTARIRRTKVNL